MNGYSNACMSDPSFVVMSRRVALPLLMISEELQAESGPVQSPHHKKGGDTQDRPLLKSASMDSQSHLIGRLNTAFLPVTPHHVARLSSWNCFNGFVEKRFKGCVYWEELCVCPPTLGIPSCILLQKRTNGINCTGTMSQN